MREESVSTVNIWQASAVSRRNRSISRSQEALMGCLLMRRRLPEANGAISSDSHQQLNQTSLTDTSAPEGNTGSTGGRLERLALEM